MARDIVLRKQVMMHTLANSRDGEITVHSDPDEANAYFKSEVSKWGKMVALGLSIN
jgi:hypothetical protein